MLRFIIRTILILFIFTAGGTALVLLSSRSDEDAMQNSIYEAGSETILTGRFIEYLINERITRLTAASEAGDTKDILQALLIYTDFVGKSYAHRGAFMVGLLDSGFVPVSGYNSTTKICGADRIISQDAAKMLLVGKSYAGPAGEECAGGGEDGSPFMIFAVPVMDDDGLKGVVYEISDLMEFIFKHRIGAESSDRPPDMLVVDDIAGYARDTREYRLLSIKNTVTERNSVQYNDDYIAGFYSFTAGNTKLCLIHFREIIKSRLQLKCCPWLDDYKEYLFASPVILLTIWIILEFIQLNARLGREVRIRTGRLESMQRRYQVLFGTIPEYVVLYTYEGEILESNARFAAMLKGGNPSGANIIYMIREKERFKNMIETAKYGKAQPEEFTLMVKDDQISVSINSSNVDIGGQSAILSVMTDMTEYRNMQRKYYEVQKKEVVGTLAAGMVHDFSNILQNISLQCTLLERTADGGQNKQMENLKTILSGAEKYLSSIIGYTKESNDRYVVKRGSEFVKEAIDMMERVLPADIDIVFEDNSGNIQIRAAQPKITQMLINLCQNSADAMNGKGEIHISTFIEHKIFGHFFCLSVRDSGVGIPKEFEDRIYKPFFTTKTGKGTGLGLATVKQVVVELGAFIEMKSEPGKGTEFIIMFSESK